MSARDNILRRIRAAQKRAATVPQEDLADYIRRHPRGPRPQMQGETVEHFCAHALRLGSTVAKVSSLEAVPMAVAAYVREQALPPAAVCWTEFGRLAWRVAGIEVEARAAHGDDMVGISGAFCGIAETGTLMLVSSAEMASTTSLLPETHIAIVDRARIVNCMEDAWDMLRCGTAAVPRSVNFISGPSRTADIEQTVVIGAHGPYRVHIVVIG